MNRCVVQSLGLHYAATEGYRHDHGRSGQYFPQLYVDRWIPLAEPPGKTPTPSPKQQRQIDALHADVQRILNGSLYLPRP